MRPYDATTTLTNEQAMTYGKARKTVMVISYTGHSDGSILAA